MVTGEGACERPGPYGPGLVLNGELRLLLEEAVALHERQPLPRTAETERPPELDMLALVRGANHHPDQQALVRVAPNRAGQVRRLARSVEHGEGADLLTIEDRDLDRTAATVAAAGVDAFVLEPPELVKAVMALLEAAAGGQR